VSDEIKQLLQSVECSVCWLLTMTDHDDDDDDDFVADALFRIVSTL